MRTPNNLPQPTLTGDRTAVILPRTLTPTGVASVLGCTPVRVRELLREGRLKGFRLAGNGSAWRILRTDFLTYIDEQKRTSSMEHHPAATSLESQVSA